MLALAVFISHVSRFQIGRPAVMIFFVLSGFWVAAMQDGAHHQRYLPFVAGRVLRVWPALAATAAIAAISLTLLNIPLRGSLLSTLGLLGLATRGQDMIGVVWSLDIEMQFYLLLPLALAARKWLIMPKVMLAASLTSFAVGMTVALTTGALTVFLYAPMFAIGLSVHLRGWAPPGKAALVSAGLCVALLSVVNWNWTTISHLRQPLIDTAFMAASATLAPFIAWNVRQRSGAYDRLLGNLSYPLYLVHYPSIRVAARLLGGGLMAKVLALVISAGMTGALFLAVERPVDALRRALRQRQNGKASVPAT